MNEILNTTDGIAAAYEKAVVTFQAHGLAAKTLMAKLEEARADPTIVGTAIFRTKPEAYSYYSSQRLSRAAVDDKLSSGEIFVCARPDGVGEFDEDGRWHEKFRAREIRALLLEVSDASNAEFKADELCRKLCWYRGIVRRIETVKEPERVEFKSHAELERVVRERYMKQWPARLDKWYRCAGRPCYNAGDHATCEDEEGNNRVVVFTGKDGVQHRVAFLRKIGYPTDFHWGFRSLGTDIYYISNSIEIMYSMRELRDRMLNKVGVS